MLSEGKKFVQSQSKAKFERLAENLFERETKSLMRANDDYADVNEPERSSISSKRALV